MRTALLVFLLSALTATAQTVQLTDAQAQEIGRRIWKNECGGTVEGLTSWNSGEDFPSLGIGHFIWYPKDRPGPFEESFPKLIAYFSEQGIQTPPWMHGACPWMSRAQFLADAQSQPMMQLRNLLKTTITQQARFAAQRMERALPKMLAAAPPEARQKIQFNFQRVAAQPLGVYALMDYVNFKGEGVKASERYKGQGWGLLQVLETMPTTGAPLPAFAQAANQVLTRRVQNAPPDRNESKWLPGWRNRLQTYLN